MKFNYQARTKAGEIQTGVVESSSKEAAINLLKSHQLYVTVLEEAIVPFYAKIHDYETYFELFVRSKGGTFESYLAVKGGSH